MTEYISNPKFRCACVDKNRQSCFAIRYPEKNPMEWTASDTCDCPCHDKYDDYENEESSTDDLIG